MPLERERPGVFGMARRIAHERLGADAHRAQLGRRLAAAAIVLLALGVPLFAVILVVGVVGVYRYRTASEVIV